jgi:hypothetical protein
VKKKPTHLQYVSRILYIHAEEFRENVGFALKSLAGNINNLIKRKTM